MTASTPEPIVFTVGDRPQTDADFRALPVGTIVEYDGTGTHYTRLERGWRDHSCAVDVGEDFMFSLGRNRIIFLPSSPTPRFRVGQVLDSDWMRDNLPVGTRLHSRYAGIYEIQDRDGERWLSPLGSMAGHEMTHTITDGSLRVTSLPDEPLGPGAVIDSREKMIRLLTGTILRRRVLVAADDPHPYEWLVRGRRLFLDGYSPIRFDDARIDSYFVVHSVPGSDDLNEPTPAANLTVTVSAPEPPPDRMPREGRLLFVRSGEHYSTYRDAEGEDVYLANGTGKVLVDFDTLFEDVPALWAKFKDRSRFYWTHKHVFREELRALTWERDEIDNSLGWCRDCRDIDHTDEQYTVGDGSERVCEGCFDSYFTCVQCNERHRDTTEDLNENEVCSDCRDNYFSWCEHCDGYYRTGTGDHQHNSCGQDCSSPAQQFRLRNDGEDWLANDTRVTVTLPAGVISPEGIGDISLFMRNWAYNNLERDDAMNNFSNIAYRLSELGDKWQTKEGNFTKRLSRFAYKEHGIKVDPEVISRVGNIARDHSLPVDFALEVTRDLNLPREDFVHEESCWWTDYYQSRCALKTNGGFGLRTFRDGYNEDVPMGRAWVMPLKLAGSDGLNTHLPTDRLMATFNTETPAAFVVFNGYGDLEGYAPARLMAHMAGMTYRKVGFSCEPMYVNNDSAYLVAPEEIASRYTDGSLCLSVQQHSNLYENEKVLTNA